VVVVCVLFVSLFLPLDQYGTRINESLTTSRYDRLLFAFPFVFVCPVERSGLGNFDSPWHTVATDFQIFERKKETDETFDDGPGLLTITRVGPECRETVGPTRLCHDAWLMSVLNDVTKKDMRKCGRDRGSSANLRPTRRVVPCCWLVGNASPEIMGHALSSESWVCCLILLVAR
jgi:hypothetical protein